MTALRKITALSLFLGASLAIPQKPTPPPKPTDNGPSLPDTLNYIKDKLLAVATLSWSVTDPAVGNPYPQSINITVVTADPTGCTLQTKQVSGAGASWTVIPLKDIAEVSVSQLPEVNEFGWTVNEPRPYALYRIQQADNNHVPERSLPVAHRPIDLIRQET